MRAVRLSTEGPIIRPDMDARMGDNINGPSLIRAPEWLPERLGEFYLYFADHKGSYIRLAVADDLLGPWRTHQPGALQLSQTAFPKSDAEFDPKLGPARKKGHVYPHIASPDAIVDDESRQIRLYFHGQLYDGPPGFAGGDIERRDPLRGGRGDSLDQLPEDDPSARCR